MSYYKAVRARTNISNLSPCLNRVPVDGRCFVPLNSIGRPSSTTPTVADPPVLF